MRNFSIRNLLVGGLLVFGAAFSLESCATPDLHDKLARHGIELMGETEAGVPADERGRYLPCRPLTGVEDGPLLPYPAGYLIVGLDRKRVPDAATLRAALDAWREDRPLRLWVRRNPFRRAGGAQPAWWEGDVVLRPR